jgi:hypothetical protein
MTRLTHNADDSKVWVAFLGNSTSADLCLAECQDFSEHSILLLRVALTFVSSIPHVCVGGTSVISSSKLALTNYMKQSNSWEANSSLASQDIPRIL